MSADFELVAVGAHMHGLPLNSELLALGAEFRRALNTAPLYRLYLLPGGPPARPGLLRVSPDEGVAVAVEVWALPTAKVGALLARAKGAIRVRRLSRVSPLAVPALIEEGREWVSGSAEESLLAEAVALVEEATGGEDSFTGEIGDPDISCYGGWRGFLAARTDA